MSLYIHMKMMRSLKSFGRTLRFLLHHVLDYTEGLQRSVPSENLPLEHDWFSVSPVWLTTRSRVSKPLNFVRPRVYRLWIFCNSASETQHRNRKDVYFCCRYWVACSCTNVLFHPWSLIPVDRAHSTYFILLIKDQFLRDGEQRPNLREFSVSRDT